MGTAENFRAVLAQIENARTRRAARDERLARETVARHKKF